MSNILTAFLLLFTIPSFCQSPPKPYGPVPSAAQLQWQETEMYCIVHFGMNTYTDKEWGYGDENPDLINLKQFNAYQIVAAAKAGGFKGIVVVAKHHDGFCLWPTKTTEHNISHSPYKNGKGDIVQEYREACDKLHMKMGIYCSPWDRNSALYGKPEYVTDVFRKQLQELYTHYGPLFITWFDGANGGDGYYGGAKEKRVIDRSTYYGWPETWGLVRKLQPNAAIFGDVGPDVRWVGNENGEAGTTSWETYTPHAPDSGKMPGNGYVKDYEGTEGHRDGKYWMPAECDVPLRPGWFYHSYDDTGHVIPFIAIRGTDWGNDYYAKSPEALLTLYYNSVGRSACLDLGLAPTKQGVISNHDTYELEQFGLLIKKTFSINLAQNATLKASNIRGNNQRYSPAKLLDNDRYSYWATNDNVKTPQLILDLHTNKTFDIIQLRENIKLGQRIEGVAIDIFEKGKWLQIATATSIGANRLIRLPNAVTAKKVRLRVTKSPVCIALSSFGLYKEAKRNDIESTLKNYAPG